MKFTTLSVAALSTTLSSAAVVSRQYPDPTQHSNGGDGPYKANWTTDATLPRHTIILPLNPPADLKMPVVVWSQGGCLNHGTMFAEFTTQLASHGFMVIANGVPNANMTTIQPPTTNSTWLKDSIDWISTNAGKGKYANIVASRMAVAGQSCGGLEAYEVAQDARLNAIGIFDSGEFSVADSTKIAGAVKKPIFYFLGGPTDIACANGERDYVSLPATTPSWKGNNGKGHQNTFSEVNAGMIGMAGVRYFEWALRGNATSGEFFTGGGAKAVGWDVASKNLDAIKATPI